MGVSILLFLVIITFICVNSQLQQYQYALPDYSLQNGAPNYNQLIQQQVPYYLQLPQEQTYYPVSQQQPVYPTNGLSNVYPTNGQGVYYPYPYQYAVPDQPQFTPEQLQQIALQQLPQSLALPQQIGNAKNNTEPQPVAVKTEQPNAFANVKTEIIDLNPQDFRRVMQRLNARPIIVSYERRVVGSGSGHPHYTVTTNSKQTNETDVPKSIETYKTTSKVYSFNKTFVLHPTDGQKVVNLHFVNGEQVSDSPKSDESETTTVGSTEAPTTTTESENPDPIIKWF